MEKLNTLKQDIESLHNQSREQFKNLANEILEEKSKKFTTQNKENIDAIMNPLKQELKSFQEKVEIIILATNQKNEAP